MRLAQLTLSLGMALHLGLAGYAAFVDTPTVDEYAHVPAGLEYWKQGHFALYSKNPPLLKLWMTLPLWAAGYTAPPLHSEPFGWGPWEYGLAYERANESSYLRGFFWARCMILWLTLATGAILWFWVRELTPGEDWPPVIASLGYLLAPTVLAHGHLATTDAGVAFLLVTTAYALHRHWNAGASVLMGLSLAAKFTAVFLLPWWLWRLARRGVKPVCFGLVLTLCTLALAYGFSGLGSKWSEFHFFSKSFQNLHVPDLPLPLPRDLIAGFDAQMSDAENGEFGNYLLGETSARGWWYYNLFALAFKETPLTLFLLLALPWTLRRKVPVSVLAPLTLLALPLLFLNPLQVGVRYLLPVFPFLFIVLGLSWRYRGGLVLVVLWSLFAAIQAPQFLAYFNPIATAFANKEDLLLDSNLDWGQDLYRVKNYLETSSPTKPVYLLYFGHTSPKHYGLNLPVLPNHPVHGLAIVSPAFVHQMSYVTPTEDGFLPIDPNWAAWLKGIPPSAHLGALLLYDLDL